MFLLLKWSKETEEHEGMLKKAVPVFRPTDSKWKKKQRR